MNTLSVIRTILYQIVMDTKKCMHESVMYAATHILYQIIYLATYAYYIIDFSCDVAINPELT